MNVKTWALFASVSVASVAIVGCGDSAGTGGAGGAGTSNTATGTTVTGSSTHATGTGATTGATTTTATSGSTTASSSTGGATCAVPNDMNDTCDHACAAAFDCGALICTAPDQLCTGFAPMGALTKAQFTGGCVTQCNAMPAFKAAIDVTDCAGTIATLKAASPAFKSFCSP